MEELTELEFAVLGTVGLLAPCSGYRVRRLFASSPSPHWSGSAGSIYPALRRLEDRELVRAREDKSSRRKTLLYSLTIEGRDELHWWLSAAPASRAMMDIDPLRVRVRMLGLVPVAQRRKFLQGAARGLKKMETKAAGALAESRRGDDIYHTLVCEGALQSVRMRRVWIEHVAASLDALDETSESAARVTRRLACASRTRTCPGATRALRR